MWPAFRARLGKHDRQAETERREGQAEGGHPGPQLVRLGGSACARNRESLFRSLVFCFFYNRIHMGIG